MTPMPSLHARWIPAVGSVLTALTLGLAACDRAPAPSASVATQGTQAATPPAAPAARRGPHPATVEDAIGMVRIQYAAARDGAVAAFSPDGTKIAAVTWRGDLARNTNVYSLIVFDAPTPGASAAAQPPVTVLTRDFPGDPDDQVASPFAAVTFLGDNRTLAFIGRDGDKPTQVYTVDITSKRVQQLTNHPTPVRSFIVGPDGALRAFAAIAVHPATPARDKKLEEDGVFLWDADAFPTRRKFMTGLTAMMADEPRYIRQYFLGAQTTPFFDSRQSRPAAPPDLNDPKVAVAPLGTLEEESTVGYWSSLDSDPQGRYALLYPYGLTDHPMPVERYKYYDTMNAYARRVAAPYGLVDLATGKIERLLDAPRAHFARNNAAPVWAPDGTSIILQTLLPLDGPDEASRATQAAAPPQWVQVDLATRRLTPLGLPDEWRVVRWDATGNALVVNRGATFGLLPRGNDGTWGPLQETGAIGGLNSWFTVATNGRIAIGVKDGLTTAPELAAFDLASKQTTVVTDLNPDLKQVQYGAIESRTWSSAIEANAFGFLVKPVDFKPGTRYPLLILLDDGTLRQEGEPYLLDAAWQLSGHAIQMLAAQGFVVLYPREPKALRGVMETPKEGDYMRQHLEAIVAQLDREGLIDRTRVGLSGWSRAGYWTDYLLMHSSIPFAAATQIDGGAREYTAGMRPFTDDELKRIRTPLLFEPHGLTSLMLMSAMSDRLDALGKQSEILYFASASHSTTRPQHRLRSLGTHIDWWRFWLQNAEDPAPAKQAQYAAWRKLRASTAAAAARPAGDTQP